MVRDFLSRDSQGNSERGNKCPQENWNQWAKL
jgi:hypothetical protein